MRGDRMKREFPVAIDWRPDKESPVPVYRQIVEFVCEKAASGAWPVGTRLPAQRTLAELFGVNRSTVATAIDELTSYGVTAGCRGAGTQIASNTWSLLLPGAPGWSKLVSSGFFRENDRTLQVINRLEFVPDMVRLGTGEPDPRLFPREMWQAVLEKLKSQVTTLGYVEPLGLPPLREAIAAHMGRLGVTVSPACILVTSGALQALQLIAMCLLQSGSTVYTEAPTYLKSLQVFQSAGMKLSGVPMDGGGMEYWRLAGALGARRQGSAILYTIPTNHNPTGVTMPADRRAGFLEFCGENRLPVIEDGAYHELCFDGPTPPPLKAMDRGGNVLYLGSASKTLAPGLRLGWIVAPEAIVQRLGDVKMQTDYGASSVSQWIFAEFLASGLYEKHLDFLRGELRRRLDSALAALDRHCRDMGTWNRPAGGFYIWFTFREGVAIERLFERAARAGLLLNPGDLYDFTHNRALRLSYAYLSPEEFEAGIARLARLVRGER